MQKEKDSFVLTTNLGEYRSTYLIWAAGEYQYPKKENFPGSDLCIHYSEIPSFSELEGEDHIVIGAYESGFDAMANLVQAGKQVTLLDSSNYLEIVKSDSSYCLSPFTRDRISEVINDLDYYPQTAAISVEQEEGKYLVRTSTWETFSSSNKPINCTGFTSSLTLVENLFKFRRDYPLLNEVDESIETENLFLVGPQVKHNNALFCFIYKYRQRFAIVAEAIARKERVSRRTIREVVREYRDYNFYLKDLSCCDDECVC